MNIFFEKLHRTRCLKVKLISSIDEASPTNLGPGTELITEVFRDIFLSRQLRDNTLQSTTTASSKILLRSR